MTKVIVLPITGKKSDKKYGGGPCELLMTDPSTFKQVIHDLLVSTILFI